MSRAVPVPTELEVLADALLGPDEAVPALPAARNDLGAALEQALLTGLTRPPCVVSFSGGRDSSAVLALATDVARRHGLAPPIPAIMRFPDAPLSDESRWQELVLGHLGLDNAEVLTLTGELDALGPAATDALRRHGVRWPFNGYMHRPIFEVARGGTVLTGVGGDELFTTTSPRRSLRQLALAGLPRGVRAELTRRRHPPQPHRWLTPAGQARLDRALIEEEVSWPYRWDLALEHWHASRAFAAMDGALDLIGHDHGVRVLTPLLDRHVLVELAAVGGKRGFPSRTEAMRLLCGHLLPDELVSRSTKAVFGGALWGPTTRDFLSAWDGAGVDADLVDIGRLQQELAKPDPDVRTVLLLHQAWLSSVSS